MSDYVKKMKNFLCLYVFVFSLFLPNFCFGDIAGNVDGIGSVDLKDCIISLQVCAGSNPANVLSRNEISGDDRVCLEEAVYALQVAAGLKQMQRIWYRDEDRDRYSSGDKIISATQPSSIYFEAENLWAITGDPNDKDASVVPGVGVTIQMTYSVPPIQGLPTSLGDDDRLMTFNFGNAPLAGDPGKPVLPVIPSSIGLPDGYTLDHVEVIQGDKVDLPGLYTVEYGQMQYPLLPGVVPTLTAKDPAVYSSDNPYPGNLYDLVGIQKLRGVSTVNVNLHPVEYRPVSSKVSYYKELTVKIVTRPDLKRSAETENRYRPSQIRSLANMIDNPEVLNTYLEKQPEGREARSGFCDPADSFQYVLVTGNAIKNAATSPNVNDLIAQRQSQGLSATIVTIEDIYANYSGTDQAEQLRNFIKDAYNNWETDFVLLGGDTNIIPMRKLWCEAYTGGDADHIPSDLYYQCLDGNFNFDGDNFWGEPTDGENGGDIDLYAEVYVGRASAENADEMANFVHKTLAYENSGITFKKKILMLGEHLGFGGISEYAKSSMEEIRTGTSNHGYTSTGFSADASFSVDGLYQQDTAWDKSEIISTINQNQYSVINHLGHANFNYVMQMANWDTDSLSNMTPSFAYSQGCIPGNFEEDCIAERLTTSDRNGMFAVVFNSRYGWGAWDSTDGASQRYNREFWDAYFSEGLAHLGSMNADSHEDNAWRINKSCMRWCYYESNLLGDPAVRFAAVSSQNQPPVAEAGDDQTVSIGNTVNLNGSASSDPDGSIVSYFWEQTEGPNVSISNVNTVQANFTAPDLGTTGGYLTFRLTVTDNKGLKSTDTCKVNVNGKQDGVVYFPDVNLDAAVREAIGKPSGDIYQSDLSGLFSLMAYERGISNLEGLQYCTNLTQLWLGSNQISDINKLSGLVNISDMLLWSNQISNISALSGMTKMRKLFLNNNQISDISPLSGMTNMTILFLSSNYITDISALSEMTNMTDLRLGSNQISDIGSLSGMLNMKRLDLYENQISNISALSGMINIECILIYDNQIIDISPLSGMKNVSSFTLSINQIRDISPLSDMTNIVDLDAYNNQISDISPLSGLTNLTRLGLSKNQINDISPLSGLTKLTSLNLCINQIIDISVLANLINLKGLIISYNQIANINSLYGLTDLEMLWIEANQINDISTLVNNSGIGNGDEVSLTDNPLNTTSCTQHIPTLQSRGVDVSHSCP